MVRCITFCLIEKVLMSEEDSDEEFSDEDTTPVGGPSVIAFQDPSKNSEASASDRTLKKAFMVRDSYEVCNSLDSTTTAPSLRKFPNYGGEVRVVLQRKPSPARMTTWTCAFTPLSFSLQR
jgi:hypothetical protein